MPQLSVHIPKPCPASQQALSPTAAGWHCARCQTEVIDFTRLSEAEVLAFLAEHRGQRVCAALPATLAPQHYQRPRGARRWLLAVAAFLGWQSAGALPPQSPPASLSFFGASTNKERIVIRGVVLDDSLKVPIAGAYIFIKGTKYGAVSNEKGEFSFSFAPDWQLAKAGEFSLQISVGHFDFQDQLATVSFKDSPTPTPVTIRLLSRPHRGFVLGKIARMPPPVAPPDSGETQP